MTFLVTAVACGVFFGVLSALITHQKGRGWGEGLALGGLLGIVGLIIATLVKPSVAPALPLPAGQLAAGWYLDPTDAAAERYWNGRAWSDLPPRPASQRKDSWEDGN